MLRGAALGSLAARFCWQGQHFKLWTVPERVSGPPTLMLPGAALGSLAAGGSFLLAGALEALDGSPFGAPFPGSLAARFCLLAGAALQALDGTRARFGARPLDAARRSTWEPRASFLLAGAALEALFTGWRSTSGPPP